GTLSFAFVEPFFFIGYLISIAIFGLYEAIFMANAGGAWDNAKKIVEVELKQKGTPLHDATVVGDTVGDPFKDTSSVALNPVIKFTTLFGLLAVELAVDLASKNAELTHILAAVFFLISFFFVYRSFYGMRINSGGWRELQAGPRTIRGRSGEGSGPPFCFAPRSGLGLDCSQKFARIVGESREHFTEIATAEVLGHDFAEHAAVVGCHRQIASLVQLTIVHSRPARVHLSALDVAAHQQHAVGMTVIGAAVAVFMCRPAEFRHADEHDVSHAIAHILMERGDSLPQIAKQIRELSLHATLIDVVVPASAVKEGNFQTQVGLEEFGNLHEALAESAVGIVCAVIRGIGIGTDFLQLVNGFEGFLADAAHRLVNCLGVHRLKAAFDGLLRAVHLELFEVRDGNGRSAASESPRQVGAERNGPER